MAAVVPFTDEQARALVNLRQRYEVWIEADRGLAALPYDLRRKEIAGKSYLYEIADRSGNGRSLGAWSTNAEERFEAYRTRKRELKARRDSARGLLEEAGRLSRALRTPMLASDAGEVLREADRRALLGTSLMVIGTNAMVAYAVEAGGRVIDAPDETQDLDFAWSAEAPADSELVWLMLKTVDGTFTVNMERPFQARNAKAYEVEFLVAPSRADRMARTDRPQPLALPEQEWLLLGGPVDQVVLCRDASAARLVAPDPRFFALQKLWLADKPERNPLKRRKDRRQGLALLDAIREAMPQYALDTAFEVSVPEALRPHYAAWQARG